MTKTNISAFVVLLSVFFAMAVVLPKDTKAAEAENLKSLPKLNWQALRANTFPKDFEDYLSDNVAYRSYIIKAAAGIESLHGIKPTEGFVEATDKFILWSDRIMERFGRNPDVEKAYAELINTVAELVDETVTIYSIVAPTQAEFFLPKDYKNLSESQKDAINNINSYFSDKILPVDCYSALEAHAGEYIYFQTDHHWTQLGAYYAYKAFCEVAGIEALSLTEDFDKHSVDGFLGYLYNLHPTDDLAKHADTIYYYIPKDENFTTSRKLIVEGSVRYAPLFIQGDWDYFDVTTSVQNGRTAIIVKDSYANCFVPFLGLHYENIIVVDPRYFEEPFSLIAEIQKYTDVDLIFLNYAFSATFWDMITLLNSIL